MINIAFDLYCDEAPLLFYSAQLFEKSINVFGVTMGKRYSEYFVKNKKNIQLENISQFLKYNWNNIDISPENLKKIESKYNLYNSSFFILSDRYLSKKKYSFALKILVGNFLFYEYFFAKYKIDFFIDTPPALLSQLVAYQVCRKMSINYLAIRVTRNKQASFVFINDWQDRWYRVFKKYTKGDFSNTELNRAKQIYKDFLTNHHKPSYMYSPKQFNRIRFSFIVEFYKRLKKYYTMKQYEDKCDYITQHPLWYVKRDLGKIARSKFLNIIHSYIFDDINIKKPFYLFPLHLQPEASTLMMAPYYVNQIATIENIAKSLPAGHYLYVKEHTSSYGFNNGNFYDKIKSINNVKLVSPFYNTRHLIQNCIATIVLTSTVGWEALILGKPVIVLGEVFYNKLKMIYKVKNYEELAFILSCKIKNYKFDEESLVSFIAAIEDSSYKGIFAPPTFREKEVLSKENILNLYKGIKNEIFYNNSNV